MDAGAPRLGVGMTPEEARNFVNQLNAKVLHRWDERVSQGAFMKRLTGGSLPLSAIQTFFSQLGKFHGRNQYADRRLLP